MVNLSFVRNRFGFLMVGLVLIVCAILLIRQKFFAPSGEASLTPVEPIATIPLPPADPAELRGEWERWVNGVLEDYDKTGDARSAKERLLLVRVPAVGRDAHLALYIAFNALSESRPEAKTKLIGARTLFQSLATQPVSSTASSTTSTR